MAARVVTVSPDMIWEPPDIQRLWFFPDGSEYLKYSPHFHIIYQSGFRQNMPLCYMFFIVLEGKLSIKDYWGRTTRKIEVWDQVWFTRIRRSSPDWAKAPSSYALMLPGKRFSWRLPK